MSTSDIVACIVNVVVFGVLILVPLSAVGRLAVAVVSPQARLSIRQHPVAHSVWFVGGLFCAFLLFGAYATGRAQARARFINFKNDLRMADYELRQYGIFTNQFRDSKIYPCTNVYTVGGTNYWCEFCGEHEEFRDRGTLAITTNQVFLWIDKKRDVILPLRPDAYSFPPGI